MMLKSGPLCLGSKEINWPKISLEKMCCELLWQKIEMIVHDFFLKMCISEYRRLCATFAHICTNICCRRVAIPIKNILYDLILKQKSWLPKKIICHLLQSNNLKSSVWLVDGSLNGNNKKNLVDGSLNGRGGIVEPT